MNTITFLPNPVIPWNMVFFAGSDRGTDHEEKTGQALEFMRSNRIPIAGSIIKSFIRSEHYSRNDMRGRDFEIEFEDEIVVPLQVKSCENAKKKFERHGRLHKKFIPVIVITGMEKLHEVVEKLMDLLSSVFKFFIRMRNSMAEKKRKRNQFRQMQCFSGCMCH